MVDEGDVPSEMVAKTVRMAMAANRKMGLLKRQDITGEVTHDRNLTGKVLERARKLLCKTFGLGLVEGRDNEYMIVNILPSDEQPEIGQLHDSDQRRLAILDPLLTSIFMSPEQKMSYTRICKLYYHLGIKMREYFIKDVTTNYEEIPLSKYIDSKLPQLLYLRKEVIEGSDPVEHAYRLGPRAEAEMDFMTTLKKACAILGPDQRPETWIEQYRLAKDQQAKRQSEEGSQPAFQATQGTQQISESDS